jgi:hypothetical protein
MGKPDQRELLLVKWVFLLTCTLCVATGCSTQIMQRNGKPLFNKEYRISDIAKSNTDLVIETHQEAALENLRVLAEKLYKHNPRELRKSGLTLNAALNRLSPPCTGNFAELNGKHGADAIFLAFDPDYTGDRVLAYMVGLSEMIMASYNDKTAFFVLDDLDPQKLYNSARNTETAARDAEGRLYLISNSMDTVGNNLSFAREFGKLIAVQDILARIIADKSNRSINWFVQTAGAMVFLPL